MQSLDFFHHLSSICLYNCFCACEPFSPERNHSADARNGLLEQKRSSWNASASVFEVLACFAERVNCPCASSSDRSELTFGKVVTGNGARNSFAVSSTFRFSAVVACVCSDISSSWSSSVLCVGRELRWSMKPCCVCPTVARGVKLLVCVLWKTNNSANVHGHNRSTATHTQIGSQIRGFVSQSCFLSFSKQINFDPILHCNPFSHARGSLRSYYKSSLSQRGAFDLFGATPSYERFTCLRSVLVTVYQRLSARQHVLVEQSYRDIHIHHPMWQDCVEDLKYPLCRKKASVLGHLVGGVQAFAENCVSLVIFDIIFLSMSPRR